MTRASAQYIKFDVSPNDSLPSAARKTSGRIVFDDFPEIWEDTNGDFRTVYRLDALFMLGHQVGARLVEQAFSDDGGVE